MRIFVLTLTFAIAIAIPVLLILFAPGRSWRARILWALAALLAPAANFALIQMIPILSNNAPAATQWERFFGLIFAGSGFVLPWLIFAVFLHRRAPPAPK